MSINIFANNSGNKNGRFTVSELSSINDEYLLGYETISIYNICDDRNWIDSKIEDNITYLNEAFKLVKRLRDNKFNGNIIVECDSLYDISQSFFNYNNMNTAFTTTKYSMDAVNNFVNCYVYNLEDFSLENSSKRDFFVRILFHQIKELYVFIEEKREMNDDVSESLNNYISSLIVQDLAKICGLNLIKCSSEDGLIYYYFDNNSNKVFKYYPVEMLDKVVNRLDEYEGFLEYDGDDEKLLADVGRAYDEIMINDELNDIDMETIYDGYLNCNSLDDLNNIIEEDDDLEDHYRHLLNILMDLSIEDYKEYKKNEDTSNLRLAINTVFSLILSKKRKLTKPKITMSIQNKKSR